MGRFNSVNPFLFVVILKAHTVQIEAKVIIVHLRRPKHNEADEMRTDPFWEFECKKYLVILAEK